jgi:hypothetical protein
MSASNLLKAASAAAHDLTGDLSARAFRNVAQEFVDLLARVPDHPASEFSGVEIEQLSTTAEHVIAAIERRLDDADDQAPLSQQLAEMIYEIRRNLEEIARWRRHYLQSQA